MRALQIVNSTPHNPGCDWTVLSTCREHILVMHRLFQRKLNRHPLPHTQRLSSVSLDTISALHGLVAHPRSMDALPSRNLQRSRLDYAICDNVFH